jgi:hypothetical protein
MVVIDNQMVTNGGGAEDLQRKRTRKQHFSDGVITGSTDSEMNVTSSDKFMMVFFNFFI